MPQIGSLLRWHSSKYLSKYWDRGSRVPKAVRGKNDKQNFADKHPSETFVPGIDSVDISSRLSEQLTDLKAPVHDVILHPPADVKPFLDKDHDVVLQRPEDVKIMPEVKPEIPESLIEFRKEPADVVDKTVLDEAQRVVDDVVQKAKESTSDEQSNALKSKKAVVDGKPKTIGGVDPFTVFKRFDK